ncbi:MAG: C2H2-type zinc finger protein [Dehalococcoides mccartyi]|uniref:C2H2-type zinc finger protein n=1 Tax=Dehalococcoides TaxID=61434 RepID=UPI0027379FB0|nr:C2H2-type zinc finger protein [Dehalococcoides mccartyi]MDP4280133.1 C2H2-type zinc finger protein [Dehalococcoides mccartyi]
MLGAYVLAADNPYLLATKWKEVYNMIKCTKCGREFKSPQALGGHMRSAHQEEPQEEVNQPENLEETEHSEEVNEETEIETALVPAEASQAEQIRSYIKQGFTVKQLNKQFGFSESTIRQEIAKLVKPEGEAIDDKAKHQDNAWPIIRKMGGGAEVISPEAVLRQYMGGTPEEELELRAIMKFRAAMLMVMDLVNVQKNTAEADAKRMEPILRLMKETREEQDAAAHRAKESNVEIADKAAYETAAQLSQVISQNNARITESINQIRQAMGGKEENPLGQVLNSIQSLQQMMQMFGINMPGMAGAPGGDPAAEQQWQPHPITHRKRNESEGGE